MAVLHRDDDALFILQPYRELLTLRSAALFKREINLLAQSYGGYSRLIKQRDGRVEAIFSRDPGYLFGESLWRHLGSPPNLLYCEALAEKDQLLLAIVRDGYVYLDAKIPYSQLAEELLPLQTSTAAFAVYVHGAVPELPLNADRIQSFTRLTASAFQAMSAQAALSLLAVEQAVAELQLNRRAYQAAGLAAIAIVGGLWIAFSSQSPAPVVAAPVAIDPWHQYAQALATPEPSMEFQAVIAQLNRLYALPGWTPVRIVADADALQFEVHSLGGSVSDLLAWSGRHNAKVALNDNGASITLPVQFIRRAAPARIADTQASLAAIIDRVRAIVPNKSLQASNTVPQNGYNATALTLTLDNISPDVLLLIGRALAGLPVNLPSYTLNISNGLLSGTLQLTLLGN
jgi:hypothetical protein